MPTAADAIEKARNLSDDEYNDKAYVQYLRASEITINLIPHHPDYRTVSQRPDWYKEFADLLKAVRSKQGTMDAIKREIIEDNLVSGMQPTGAFTSRSPEQISDTPRGRENQESGTNFARMPSPTQYQRVPETEPHLQRYSSPADDTLAQRFAKLKASPPSNQYGLGANTTRLGSGVVGSAGQTPLYPSNYNSPPPRRPLGPRVMGSSSNLPTIPPKLPLNTSLPRAPDPAYSPVFTVPS